MTFCESNNPKLLIMFSAMFLGLAFSLSFINYRQAVFRRSHCRLQNGPKRKPSPSFVTTASNNDRVNWDLQIVSKIKSWRLILPLSGLAPRGTAFVCLPSLRHWTHCCLTVRHTFGLIIVIYWVCTKQHKPIKTYRTYRNTKIQVKKLLRGISERRSYRINHEIKSKREISKRKVRFLANKSPYL